jgi:hypothetical protein
MANRASSWSGVLLFALWSGLAVAAPAELSIVWRGGEGDFEDAANWTPSETPGPGERGRWIIRGGPAVLSGEASIDLGGDLLVAQGGPGSLILRDRAELHLKRHLSIGQSRTSDGEVEILDKSSLVIEEGMVSVGQRGAGTITVGGEAALRIMRGQLRIGDGAEGSVAVAGILDVPRIIYGGEAASVAAQNGRLAVEASARVNVHHELSFGGSGAHLLEVRNGGAEIILGRLQASPSAVLRFIAGDSGVSPLQVRNEAVVSDAVLEVDADLASDRNLPLLSASRIVGEFREVRWLGEKQGKIEYGPTSVSAIVGP